jgi:hypothetical protein
MAQGVERSSVEQRTGPPASRRRGGRIAALLAGVAWVGGCCGGPLYLLLTAMAAMITAIATLIGATLVFAAVTVTSTGDWAELPGFDEPQLGYDTKEATVEQSETEHDVDKDGANEKVRVLRYTWPDDPTDAFPDELRVFAWRGDDISLDDGFCYLSWLHPDGRIHVATARCGETRGVVSCDATAADPKALECRACAGGGCTPCDPSQSIDQCTVESAPQGTGAPDAGPEPDAGTTDTGGEPGEDTSPGDPLAECKGQVAELVAAVNGCGEDITVDAAAVCASSESEVSGCHTAYEAATAFGQSVCSVVPNLRKNAVCGFLAAD